MRKRNVHMCVRASIGLAWAAAALGAGDRELSLTIYNENIALVEHVRAIDTPAGRQRVEFPDVSAQIVPATVSFLAPDAELIEQNFDYDLLTPAKLMEKAIGGQVRLVRVNPATGVETSEIAEILSTTGGTVMRIGSRIEVLREDLLPTRVIFDKVPDNLRARPTLSVLIDAAKPVKGNARLTYLTRGISWSADYVVTFDESNGQSAMQGWTTLRNSSGTAFANARVQLVAGDVNLVDNEEQWWMAWQRRRAGNANQRAAGTQAGARPRLGDYYVYPLREPTTITNNQNKQVSFLDAGGVKSTKGYEASFSGFASSDEARSAEVRLRFANSRAGGLGEPLPAGLVRVYMRDARGTPQFIGEDHIGHTSAGSELALKVGDAFDVTVLPTLENTSRDGTRTAEYEMSYRVRNARGEPIVLTLRQTALWGENTMLSESIPGRRADTRTFAWDVPVPANGETTLRFQLRRRW